MEEQRARHIGDILKERDNQMVHDLATVSGPEHDFVSRIYKIFRSVFGGALDALAAIGWFVTLPFITHNDCALTAREQHRR